MNKYYHVKQMHCVQEMHHGVRTLCIVYIYMMMMIFSENI